MLKREPLHTVDVADGIDEADGWGVQRLGQHHDVDQGQVGAASGLHVGDHVAGDRVADLLALVGQVLCAPPQFLPSSTDLVGHGGHDLVHPLKDVVLVVGLLVSMVATALCHADTLARLTLIS